MGIDRREFLQGILAYAVAAVGAALGLIGPRRALAAEWPRDAYAAKTVEDALKNLYGTSATIASAEIKLRVPAQAENGAVVPISVSANLADVQAISVLVEKNVAPLAAHIAFTGGAVPYFATNVKMASTSDLHFIVKAGGKLYSAKQNVKVTVGGCGG
jgi:sulfur-oxidizing protein SoxY